MSIQEVKEFWNKRPCNIRHSDKEVGSMEYFLEVSKRKYTVEPHILNFADFEQWKNKKVLEVGCGIGTAAHSFIENGAIYKGIDLSKKSIEVAKQRLNVFNLNGTIEEADIENYSPSITEKYDLVYSFGVLHHTPDTKKAIKNIYNLLNDGGTFKLMLYAKNSWKYLCIKDGLDRYEAESGVPIADVYTNEEVYNLLKDFKNIEIQQKHIFSYKIPEYKKYKYEKQDYFEAMPNQLFKCLEDNLGWHLCITCKKENILNKYYSTKQISKPYEHIIIKDMFNYKTMDNVCDSIGNIDSDFWNDSKIFFNNYTKKKEINDYRKFPKSLEKIFEYLISESFVKKLEKLTNIDNLIIDNKIYGGGLVISPPGAHLQKHTDFNFNTDIQLYRSVNLILYLNKEWEDVDGGNLELYDDNNNKYSINPIKNTIFIFKSNNNTPHGFSKITSNKCRKSLNIWYYTKYPLDYVDKTPHKTLWL
jgi:SAM-dependent methyltransferase